MNKLLVSALSRQLKYVRGLWHYITSHVTAYRAVQQSRKPCTIFSQIWRTLFTLNELINVFKEEMNNSTKKP